MSYAVVLHFILLLSILSYVAGQVWCANENGLCVYGNNRVITSFCLNNDCTYKESKLAKVSCNWENFGDPTVKSGKSCSYTISNLPTDANTFIDPGTWIFLGNQLIENEVLKVVFIYPKAYLLPDNVYAYRVRYCDVNRYYCFYRTFTGQFVCDDQTFGDPDVGNPKYCDYRLEPVYGPDSVWTPLVQEGGAFTVNNPTYVRFGTGLPGSVYYYRLVSGTINCYSTLFDVDPLPGQYRTCYALTNTSPQVSIPVGTWYPVDTCFDCTASQTLEVGVSSTVSNSDSTTITNGFSIGISQGIDFEFGSTEISISYDYSDAIETAVSNDLTHSFTSTCQVTCGSNVANYYAIYQWQMTWSQTSDMVLDQLRAQTCNFICRTDTIQPACPLSMCNINDGCATCNTPSGTLSELLPYQYNGCGVDSSSSHVLPYLGGQSSLMTPSLCYGFCSNSYGSLYFGLQLNQCFCGSSNPFSLGKSSDASCSTRCGGNNYTCGSTSKNSVYINNLPIDDLGNAISPNFFFVACGTDSVSRALPIYAGSDAVAMTPQRCYTLCIQHNPKTTYFGVQDGNQCFCTTDYVPLKQGLSPSCCTAKCPGNNNFICGGTWCNSVYKLANLPVFTILADVEDDDASDADKGLPTWVIPVAVVGGIVAVVLVGVVIFLIIRRSQPVQVDDYLKT